MSTLAGTNSNEFFLPAAGTTADPANYRGGLGNDTYILSGLLIPANASIKIIDGDGANKIQLTDGLAITSSSFYADEVTLTLSNGATVQIQGADTFTYDIGANMTSGDVAATPNQTFAQFAVELGVTTPLTSTSPTTGVAYVVSPPVVAPNYTLTSTGAVIEGEGLTFTLKSSVAPTTDQTFNITLTGDTLTGAVGAAATTDFNTLPATVKLLAGATEATFVITPKNDNTAEGGEGAKISVFQGGTAVASAPLLVNDAAMDTTSPVLPTGQAISYGGSLAAGAVLGKLTVSDDTAVTAINIISGNADGFFAVAANGDVTLTDKGAAAGAASNDFNVLPNTYNLVVKAVDGANNTSLEATVTLSEKDTVSPALSANPTLGGKVITLTFNEALDPASIPSGAAFTVMQGTTNITVNSVTPSGSSIALGLIDAPTGAITVSYTPPVTNPLQDVAGNDVLTIASRTVITDTAPPTLLALSSTPADGATSVAVDGNIVLNFSESVQIGTGNIKIVSLNGTDNRTISITDASQVTVSGNTVTINPTTDLASGLDYSIQMAAGVVKDTSGNSFAGIIDATTLNFTTTQPVSTDLTSGSDILTGNTFDGTLDILSGQSVETLTSGDRLTGTGTNPTLNLEIQQYGHTVTPLSVTGIQTMNVTASTLLPSSQSPNDPTLNFANVDSAVKNFSLSGQTQDFLLTNIINPIAAFGLNNVGADVGNTITGVGVGQADFTATFQNAALAGATDSTTITLNQVPANVNPALDAVLTFQPTSAGSSGFETINLVSVGGVPNAIILTDGNGNSLSTLNVTGTTALWVAAADTTITKVDASAMTGGLTFLAAAGNAQNMSVTGGTGNDAFGLNGYTPSDVINGGDGIDGLLLTNAEGIGATTKQSNVSNIEVVGLTDPLNGTVSLANFGAIGFQNAVNNGLAGNSTINFSAGTGNLDLQNSPSNGNTLTANVTGSSTTDVLNVTAGTTTSGILTGTDGTGWGSGAVTLTGAETVNLLSQGGANVFGGNFTLTNSAAPEKLAITGNQNLTFGGTITADAIDANAFTGNLVMTQATANVVTITGGAGADVLRGSAAADNISGGAGNDTIYGGASGDIMSGGEGSDRFVIAAGETFATPNKATALDTISGLVLGNAGTYDALAIPTLGTLAIRNSGAAYSGAVNEASLNTDLMAGVGLTATVTNSQGYLFTANSGDQSGKTFLVVDVNNDAVLTAGTDLVINVTGATGALTTSNFVAPTYALTPVAQTVNEGVAQVFNLATTNVANGTVLNYAIAGAGITAADFTSSSLTGFVTVNGNAASLTLTPTADATTEGNEIATVTLTNGTTAVSTAALTITDSSTAVAGDTTAPNLIAGSAINANVLTLNFNEVLATGASAPTPAMFAVTANGVAVTPINSVAIAGTTATLTLGSSASTGQTVLVSYTDPSVANDAAALQDAAGNDVATFSNAAVTNNTPAAGDTTAPVFSAAAVNGNQLVMTYTDANNLDTVNVATNTAFAVTAGGVPDAVTSVAVNAAAKTVVLTLATAVTNAQAVTVAYTDPTAVNDANAIQDAAGNDAATLAAMAVFNNTPVAGDITAPVFSAAAVNGNQLVMTYTDANNLDAVNVATNTAFAVTAGGAPDAVTGVVVNAAAKTVALTLATPVTNGQAVTVAYTDPTAVNDANAIQDAAGNDAATLTATAVTNNTVAAFTAYPLDGKGSAAGQITETLLTGAFNLTDNVATANNVKISNFTADDMITITGATSAQYDTAIVTGLAGDVTIAYTTTGGVLNEIVLVGVAGTSTVYDVASFNALSVGNITFA
jgi:uncharacterized repeat protein (TIGR02059 family)